MKTLSSIKSIKSLALVLTLAIVLTVGAVYATFVYSQGSPDAVANEFGKTNFITDATVSGKKGTIKFGTNTLQLKVKNKGGNVVSYDVIDGSVTATFTPDTNADEDVAANGIVWQMKIEFTGNNTYNGQSILTTTAGTPVKFANDTKSKTVTLDNDILSTYINVTEFTLLTKAQYDAYKTAYESIKIKITLSEFVDATV